MNDLMIIIGVTIAICAFTSLGWAYKRQHLCHCRNCKSTRLYRYQDGGHDYVEGCRDCGAEYGVQDDPFNLVERIR